MSHVNIVHNDSIVIKVIIISRVTDRVVKIIRIAKGWAVKEAHIIIILVRGTDFYHMALAIILIHSNFGRAIQKPKLTTKVGEDQQLLADRILFTPSAMCTRFLQETVL